MNSDDEIQVLQFGTIHKGYTYCDDRTWKRADIWTRREDGEQISEHAFCDGPDDRSDRAITPYAGRAGNITYSADCSCCYLGITHTVALHVRRLKKAEVNRLLREDPPRQLLPMKYAWLESANVYYFPTWDKVQIHLFHLPRDLFDSLPKDEPVRLLTEVNVWTSAIVSEPHLEIHLYTDEPPTGEKP